MSFSLGFHGDTKSPRIELVLAYHVLFTKYSSSSPYMQPNIQFLVCLEFTKHIIGNETLDTITTFSLCSCVSLPDINLYLNHSTPDIHATALTQQSNIVANVLNLSRVTRVIKASLNYTSIKHTRTTRRLQSEILQEKHGKTHAIITIQKQLADLNIDLRCCHQPQSQRWTISKEVI